MRKIKNALAAFSAALTLAVLNISAFAAAPTNAGGGLSGSKAVTGTTKLLNDFSNVLLVVAPLVGVVCIIYFAVRHAAADEMDQKKWKQRIVVAVVSVIVAILASSLISVLLGYYQ